MSVIDADEVREGLATGFGVATAGPYVAALRRASIGDIGLRLPSSEFKELEEPRPEAGPGNAPIDSGREGGGD